MAKNLTNILKDSFELWRKNLILGVPPVLNMLLQFVIWFAFVIVILVAVIGFGLGAISLLENIENINTLIESLGAVIVIWTLPVLLVILISMLIDAFFMAGLIGMAKEAIETGKTEFSTMIDCGKKKFISLFFANLIVTVIALLPLILFGVIFLILIAAGYGSGFDYTNIGPVLLSSLLLFILLFMLWIIYMIIIGIIFAVVNYTVVISDAGAVEGVKLGFKFFMSHKQDVFLMWLIILCISLALTGAYLIIHTMFSLIPVIGRIFAFILQVLFSLFMAAAFTPITAVWWSMLYMDREQKIERNEVADKE